MKNTIKREFLAEMKFAFVSLFLLLCSAMGVSAELENCVDLQKQANGGLRSGLYSIKSGGNTVYIYCYYGNGDGYVYLLPSISNNVNLNLAYLSNDHSLVKVIHKRRQNGKQYEATMQQIPAFNSLPVSVQFNKHDGYQGILNKAMGPYMFIGFVPLSHNVKGGVQGWKVNGQEFTFTNCDGNPNSYFSVLFNANKPGYTSYNGWKNPLMYAWYNLATQVPVSEELPDALFSPDYEIHHGGCGGYSIGTTEGDITGVAIGQRFVITCSVPDDVMNASKTLGGLKPGSIVIYSCNPGYKGSGDLVRMCTSTGGWSGVQPTCISEAVFGPGQLIGIWTAFK
ncbi:uncharacterized protein LOC127834258 isoform X2 [Dreissena polymorpha]|uniref:uncharacterized protein LOC127834258 isoform X2 n=1 Tax=Dreissena polymorpha TaxID=45954 RepID=UPI002264E6A6|nr:uncharacterized protein LOC127834258 isoform X2 [Dreissena polymorpha]